MSNPPIILKIAIPIGKFYVYTLARPDGSVFYVGKGKAYRVNAHEKEAATGCECPRCFVIQSAWNAGEAIIKTIVFESSEENAVLTAEREMIRSIGRDNLCNRSDGGEGKTHAIWRAAYQELLAELKVLRKRLRRTGYYDSALFREVKDKETKLKQWRAGVEMMAEFLPNRIFKKPW